MKNVKLIGTLLVSMTILAAVSGCHHPNRKVITIPGPPPPSQPVNNQPNVNPGPGPGVVESNPAPITSTNMPLDNTGYEDVLNGKQNREQFKADTVYFDLDSATIKTSEETKLQDVATYFKGNTKREALIIEGNCDERGTEKYNLSLGERRALAVREYLANLGVDPHRIKTVTYGKSRPVDPGHNEEAWKKNRRDDFVLVTLQ